MQFLKELPAILYQEVGEEGLIGLEVNGVVETVPEDRKKDDIVFVGRMDKTIYLIFGRMVKHEYIEPENVTRLTINGNVITATWVSVQQL